MTCFAKLEHCFLIYLPMELATAGSVFFQKKQLKQFQHLDQRPAAHSELFTQLEPPQPSSAW